MEDKKLSKVFLYAHGGSGNHGCEALVRSTIKLLNSADVTLISTRPDEDIKYGIDHICTIIKETNDSFAKTNFDFAKAYFALKVKKDSRPMEKLRYKDAFNHIKKGDIALSIGGDNYCYADVDKYIMMHEMLIERGAKTVLWGCSIESEIAAKPEVSTDLARYDLITAREPITYSTLKRINPKTLLVSDSAFQLDIEQAELPDNFVVQNTVGINLSPMAIENESTSGITWENYTCLIDYIINATNMNVAFIPHVIWNDSDDRIPLKKLYEKYKNTGRVCFIEDARCTKLKYIISKCRFFIGARTHSTIAAYSTNVPTLVLGYSVKSKGIARYLFGNEKNHVISVQDLNHSDALLRCFVTLMKNEQCISSALIDRNMRRSNVINSVEDLIKCLD